MLPTLLPWALLLGILFVCLSTMEKRAREYMAAFEMLVRKTGAEREKLYWCLGMLPYSQFGGHDAPIPWLTRVRLSRNMYWPVSEPECRLMSVHTGLTVEQLMPLIELQRTSAKRTLKITCSLMAGWFLFAVSFDALW